MKRFCLVSIFFVGVCMNGYAQDNAEQQVRAAEAAQVKAVLERDEAMLKTLWSPRLVVNAPTNKVNDVPGALAGMRAGAIQYHAYEQSIEKIEVFGDTAIVVGQEMVKPVNGPAAGKTVQRRFLDVWQRSGDHWIEIGRQATVISSF